ncbi:MAG: guanylate kinase [Deltaproteobacteria bacterium]|nr:guanylate kinase [Deltaproteobacteria bacterium]
MIRKGILFIVSAPSGTGKTSLCSELLRAFPDLILSISSTTRPKREGEQEGKDYFFLTQEQFEKKIQKKEFAEWARVYGQRYGTSRKFIEDQVEHGNDLLFEIDTQGALALKSMYPNSVLVFIFPPSLDHLRLRLEHRGKNTSQELEERLKKAQEEIRQSEKYDYFVVNDVFEEALVKLKAIIVAERNRKERVKPPLTLTLSPHCGERGG